MERRDGNDRPTDRNNNNPRGRPLDFIRLAATNLWNADVQNIFNRVNIVDNNNRPNPEQQRLESLRDRVQRLMGMDNDEQRQYQWRLMKEESNGITAYETNTIQEWRKQQRDSIDDREMQMWEEIENGSRDEGSLKMEMETIMSEYRLQEMQLMLDEVHNRIEVIQVHDLELRNS